MDRVTDRAAERAPSGADSPLVDRVSVEEIARRLGVPPGVVARMVENGVLQPEGLVEVVDVRRPTT